MEQGKEIQKDVNEIFSFLKNEEDISLILENMNKKIDCIKANLEKKPKRINMQKLDQKLAMIIKILYNNGFKIE